MKTSLWIDILLEVAEYIVIWVWNYIKQKIMENRVNKV